MDVAVESLRTGLPLFVLKSLLSACVTFVKNRVS